MIVLQLSRHISEKREMIVLWPVYTGRRGGRGSGLQVTLASGLTLAGRAKIARVYKQNFTGRGTLQPGKT